MSSQVELANFSYKLTDLKPHDWTLPSLKPGSNGSSLTLSNSVDLSGVNTSSPEDRSTYTSNSKSTLIDTSQLKEQVILNGGLSQVSKTGGTLTAKVSGDASTFANVPFGFSTYVDDGASLTASTSSSSWWTLSANTAAVFTGTLRFQLGADASLLANGNAYLQSTGVSAIADAWASVYMAAFGWNGAENLSVINAEGGRFSLVEQFGLCNSVAPPGGTVTNVGNVSYVERSFEIQVKNTSFLPVSLYFANGLRAYSSVYAIDATYAIPEPGTWALMTLGLGLMGWRVKTTRRA